MKILSFARHVRDQVSGQGFDLVYSLTPCFPHDLYRMSDGIYRYWLTARYPSTLSRFFHSLIRPAHLANLYLEKKTFGLNSGTVIVSNSKLCKQHAKRFYNLPDERVHVVYNGVDHEVFNPTRIAPFRGEIRKQFGIDPEEQVLLFVSNNWKRKGLKTILGAIKLLGEKNIHPHLLVIGRGKPKAFKNDLSRLVTKDRVHFIQPVPAIDQYYSAGDVLVLPTLYDPFANVCLEAMACGKPVVTTASNGASELIAEGLNGFVLDNPNDAQTLAEYLERSLEPSALKTLSDSAFETAQGFSIERNVKETLALFLHFMV